MYKVLACSVVTKATVLQGYQVIKHFKSAIQVILDTFFFMKFTGSILVTCASAVFKREIGRNESAEQQHVAKKSKTENVLKSQYISLKTTDDAHLSEVAKLKILLEADSQLDNIISLILNDKKDKVIFEKAGVSWRDDFEIIYQYLKNKELGVFLMTVIKHGLTGIVIPYKERKELEEKLSFYSKSNYNKHLVKVNFRKLLQEKQYDTLMRSLPEIKSTGQFSFNSFRDANNTNDLHEKVGGALRKRPSIVDLRMYKK